MKCVLFAVVVVATLALGSAQPDWAFAPCAQAWGSGGFQVESDGRYKDDHERACEQSSGGDAAKMATCMQQPYESRNDESKAVNAFVWEDVPPAQWGFSLAEDGSYPNYPLGFRDSGYLNEDNDPPLCLYVKDTRNKKVEIMVEAVGSGATQLCIRDATANSVNLQDSGSVHTCGYGKVTACFADKQNSNSADSQFVIYCKESCETEDIKVNYRVRKSHITWAAANTEADTALDMWCEMMSTRFSSWEEAEAAVVSGESTAEMFPQYYPSDLAEKEFVDEALLAEAEAARQRGAGAAHLPFAMLTAVLAVAGLLGHQLW